MKWPSVDSSDRSNFEIGESIIHSERTIGTVIEHQYALSLHSCIPAVISWPGKQSFQPTNQASQLKVGVIVFIKTLSRG